MTAEDDSGETTSVLYTFRIADENDNCPTFQGSTFRTLAIPEDQPVSCCTSGVSSWLAMHMAD